jgi:hypothetical protein
MRIMRAKWLLITTLLVAAGQAAPAQGLPAGANPSVGNWPPFVTLNRSAELPGMAEDGQMRTAKLPEGAMVQLLKVDGDRVEVLYQGLTVRLPASVTDLSHRLQTPKPAVAPAPPSAPPVPQTPTPPPPSEPSPDSKTFIESAMSGETFKTAGLDKLSPAELQVLDRWFLDIMLTSKRGSASPQPGDPSFAALGGKAGSVERALLVKNFNGERILIQRTNGEKWMLRAKTWCRWSWRYEGRHVCLVFGKPTSQLINDYGETYDFLTDKQVQ